jgi:signal transduction histidine kinase
MVNNVLDMVRVESGTLEIADDVIDAVDFAATVMAPIEPLASQRGVGTACEVSPAVPLVRSDWAQLEKIVGNLLSNAVKFTDAGGRVRLAIDFDEAASMLVLSVSDDGIGIAPDRLEGIFDRFVQADASISRKYRGSGLGLSLVKKTAEALGGSVAVESVLGQGSVFTVRVPVTVIDEEGLDEDFDCR